MMITSKNSTSLEKSEEKNDAQWEETRGKIKKRWNKLNHLEIESLRDNMGLLSTQLEKRYGFSDEFAKYESDTFVKKIQTDKKQNKIEKDYPNIDEMQNSPPG